MPKVNTSVPYPHLLYDSFDFLARPRHVSSWKKPTLTPEQAIAAGEFKQGEACYEANATLRGLKNSPLSTKAEGILLHLPSLPLTTLQEDTFFYRGLSSKPEFDPLQELRCGERFKEFGFTSLTPIEGVAKLYRYYKGVIMRILLPKGTQVIDINSLVKSNLELLPPKLANELTRQQLKQPELVLLPNANFRVSEYSGMTFFNEPEATTPHLGRFEITLVQS